MRKRELRRQADEAAERIHSRLSSVKRLGYVELGDLLRDAQSLSCAIVALLGREAQ